MRIAFLTPEFVTEPYFSGGLANYIYRLCTALLQRGHEVHVITYSEQDDSECDYQGIQVYRISASEKALARLNALTFSRLRSTTKWLVLSYQYYAKLRELHRRRPLDIVQYANYNFCGLVSSLLLPLPAMLRISTYSPVWHDRLGARRTADMKAVEWLERFQLYLSKNIYAPSYTLKRMVEQQAGVKGIAVIRTPVFIETRDWDNSVYGGKFQGKQYLLFIGRFQLHKGFHILAQALPRLFKLHPDCCAVLAGLDIPTPMAESMKDYARSLCGEYADRLIFIGQIAHEQLYPVIKGARLVVLPSLIDNLPNACLEAMALGKPVVGTRGASFEEMIREGETGFLVTPGDSAALADKLCEAWVHPQLEEIGRAAQADAQAYDPDETVQALLDYAQEVIDQSRLHFRRRRADRAYAGRESI